MRRHLTIALSIFLGGAAPSSAPAEGVVSPTVTISGIIRFEKHAPLYLRLIAVDEKANEIVVRERIVELTDEDATRGSFPFEFAGVPPGRYAVKCFQDTNGNRKLDIGMFGPKEPWAVHRPARPKLRPPRFEEMAFEASEDVVVADLILR